MTSNIVIDARDVTLRFGSGTAAVDVLRGVSLKVEQDERLAILGPSGSGKSSLMAVLSGLERATSGKVLIAGADFSALDEDGLARARRGRIGIVLQAFHLIPTMTAVENVAIPLELAGISDPETKARAELERVGLGHRIDHYPTELSGGEQQRVGLARAIAARPALIFADEPTGNLDEATGNSVVELLFDRLTETGATLILITHDAALAARCDRIIEMKDGHIIRDQRHFAELAVAE
ncbi:ABC transporter ATP-binding protein [Polymorphobacter glacialis]|uniref:ABC transporter ATP-binding protein n=1 Tax=Sandarakinorhabdus glacialis TaxID=1614636 RepID=A0A917E3E5_9SPHN|nr:ATP-binding cassette domain-containing protein [Polymorphobacter glacialis]GGD99252.1 ABC transporter ATP-binding protein [Polymorphobacter glacialis]